MSSTQLSFTLSTSSKVKTVHLLGSWDKYSGQLPLSKDSSKPGKWKGTFRFGGSTLKAGSRYWFYYIVDGYQVAHNPSMDSTKEPSTGRMLNILDVPKGSSKSTKASRTSVEIPKGRALSPSKIVCPKPSKPYASRAVREADYEVEPGMDDLTEKLEQASLYKHSLRDVSPPSSCSSGPSSDRSSPASLSSLSDPASSSSSGSRCSCNRYGITRRGDRVKLDCGGNRCGYSDDSSSCSSIAESSSEDSSSQSDSEPERPTVRSRGNAKTVTSKSTKASAKYVEIKPKSSKATTSSRRR